MKFVRCSSIKENMVLARDLHLFDQESNKVLLLRKGAKLTTGYIKRLKEIGIAGAYIKDGIADEIEIHTVMRDEEKVKAILEVKSLFDASLSKTSDVTNEDVAKLQDVANGLVHNILYENFVRISIGDIKSYDDYTYHHSLSVAVLSIAIGQELGLSVSELNKLGVCALLHDIGKTGISKSIIDKPAKLSFKEYAEVKRHALLGGMYLRERNLVDDDIYKGVITHHERYDGTGYPHKLKGKTIPLFGRIIAIADVYDALTSNRPFRTPMQPTEAFEYIMGNSGIHFDPDIVDVFMRKVEPYPIGSCVLLSNGEIAIVINTFDELPLRPVVRTIKTNHVYDLQEDLSLIGLVIKGYYAEVSVEEVTS